MARFKKVLPSEFDQIYKELLLELNPSIPRDVWRRLFTHNWEHLEDYVGFALVENDDETPVGFLGLIFSEMEIAGKLERFCNVTSWVARPNYEAESASLLFALRDLKDYTITNLSCNESAYRIFSSLGFKPLESHKRVIPPASGLVQRLRPNDYRRIFDVESIREKISALDNKLLQDHLSYVKPMLAWDQSGYCLLLYTLGKRRGLGSARIHYMSNSDLFRKYLRSIQASLLRRHTAPFLECDERFLHGMRVDMSYKTKVFRLFKSRSLEKEQITNLYSELVLLALDL